MDPARPTHQAREEARVAHLMEVFGGSGRVEHSGRTTFVVASEVDSDKARLAMAAVERTIVAVEGWVALCSIPIRNPLPAMTIGLFGGRDTYDRYLISEGLRGLSGSLGMTHPVRTVSCALVGEGPPGADPRTVVAHESIHLWTLRSGLCPAWHTWPRWLHEGFAQLWDHLSTADEVTTISTSPGFDRSKFRIEPNRERLRDWRRIALSTDLEKFLRTDMIRDHRRHGDDYATCWAITFALATWGSGESLAGLMHHLAMLDLQPFSGVSAEQEALDWLKTRTGGKWSEFRGYVASSGKA